MRGYLAHRLRNGGNLLATGVAVALSVLFVVATLMATGLVERYAEESVALRERVADAVVLPGRGARLRTISTTDLERLAGLPQVASTAVDRTATLSLSRPDGVRATLVESAAVLAGHPWYRVVDGEPAARGGRVLVDQASARRLGVSVGDTFAVSVAGPAAARRLVVAGLYRVTGPQPTTLTPLAVPEDLTQWSGGQAESQARVRGVEVAAAPGVDRDRLVAALRTALPSLTVTAGTAETRRLTSAAGKQVELLGRVGLGFTGVAGLVAVVVIGNTFTVLLAQRTREMALLRCLGATRRQLERAAVAEAATVGVCASTVGALLGVLLAIAVPVIGPLFWPPAADLHPSVDAGQVLAPVALGTLATVLAGRAPARRAGRVSPLAALRPQAVAQQRRHTRLRAVAAVISGSLATPLIGLALVAHQAWAAALGGILAVLSALAATPVLVPWAGRIAAWALRPTGPAVRIAAANTVRNARRSATTSTALLVGVLLVTTLGVLGATYGDAGVQSQRRIQPVDITLLTGFDEDSAPLHAGVVDGTSRITGITRVAPLRGVSASITRPGSEAGQAQFLLVGDAAVLRRIYRADLPLTDDVLIVPPGTGSGADPQSSELADGTEVTLAHGRNRVTVTIRVVDGAPSSLVSSAVGARLGARDSVIGLWARAADDADPTRVMADVRSLMAQTGSGAGLDGASSGGVTVLDYVAGGSLVMLAELDKVLSVAVRVAAGLLAVAVLVSLAGIANTTSLSVLERSGELAVSRALGATRRQIEVMVVVEALLTAVVGAALGLGLGVVLGWSGAYGLLGGDGPLRPPSIPVAEIAAVLLLAVAGACVGAALPARRAGRIPPARAIAQG